MSINKLKLLIQIPCYNEAATLPLVIKEIPKEIDGIAKIEMQIIDDGSTDNTAALADELGVHHIIRNIGNKGLGNSFRIGIENALYLGADILVNTDGDNQYPSKYITDLIQPIVKGEADIVVGNRQTSQIKYFSPLKKFFQWLGTKVTILLSGEREVEDAVSGFRAYSRAALIELNVTSSFSYVLDTTIQASHKKIKMTSIPIVTNPPTRPSRLFKNIWQHIRKSSSDIIRVYALYKPLRIFVSLGVFFVLIGIIPIFRFLHRYFFIDEGDGNIQSLILGAACIIVSINFFSLGIIGDILSKNRFLIEDLLKREKDNINKR